MLRHPPANNQRTVALFLARGHHDSLMRRLSHAFRDRWQKMAQALPRHLPECSFRPTSGGTAYWITGPERLDSEVLAQAAAARGVVIEPGAVHFQAESGPRNHFRLGFSSIPVDRIEPGLELLGKAMHEQPQRKTSSRPRR
jgi:GntR family transcriptional regulator/MocR family aminotransferase